MKGTFDFIPELKGMRNKKREKLSNEELRQINDLKIQRQELNKQIGALDPSSNTNKRAIKRDEEMSHL